LACSDILGNGKNITISEAIEALKKNDKIPRELKQTCLAFFKTLKEITCRDRFSTETLDKLISLSSLCEVHCASSSESIIKHVIQPDVVINGGPN